MTLKAEERSFTAKISIPLKNEKYKTENKINKLYVEMNHKFLYFLNKKI
jgi:hypothetical protein